MTSSWPHLGFATNQPYSAQAYTAVNARTSLTNPVVPQHVPPPPPPPPPPPATTSSGPSPFPPGVHEYVRRAFLAANMIAGIDHNQISTKLRAIIGATANPGSTDWSLMPLPQELIRAEQNLVPTAGVSSLDIGSSVPDFNTKKRKSLEPESVSVTNVPPWRAKAQTGRSEKKQKKAQEFRASAGPSKFNDLEKRKQRFGLSSHSSPVNSPSAESDAMAGPVVGTCQDLEKRYFRLTSAPKPETVRPLPVLRQTLELLIRKWKDEHNYTYMCDQFKSLRQDLTVQHIKNEFTVRVYEAHARIALEKGDLGEYNQCQSQLKPLYKQNLGGRPGEFTAYRILYLIHTCNRTGMNDMLAELTVADKSHAAVKHALEVRSSLATGNYHRFFQLYEDPPNMGGYLMDMFVQRERVGAMASISKAYKPNVKVEFLTKELAFSSDQECAQFLCDFAGEELFETRADGVRFLSGKAIDVFRAARQSAFKVVDIKGQI